MDNSYKKSNIMFRLLAVLLSLTLVSVWLLSGIAAKFTTQSVYSDSAKVAQFTFNLADANNTRLLDLANVKNPGDSEEYDFVVTNNKAGRVTEVAVDYVMNIKIDGSMPIKCVVTDKATNEVVFTVSNYDSSFSTKATSKTISFNAGSDSSNEYVLTAQWPEDMNDTLYADTSATSVVAMSVDAVQVD